jgi:glycerol-3-phosphate dehydrogenase
MNHQGKDEATPLTVEPGLHLYGPMQGLVQSIQGSEQTLGLGLTEAMVRYAVRHEQACTVQDVLARRHRMLFLNARLAQTLAPQVAEIMREEGVAQPQLLEFLDSCPQYQI